MVSSMIVSLHSEQGKSFKVTVILLNMFPGFPRSSWTGFEGGRSVSSFIFAHCNKMKVERNVLQQ